MRWEISFDVTGLSSLKREAVLRGVDIVSLILIARKWGKGWLISSLEMVSHFYLFNCWCNIIMLLGPVFSCGML